MPSGKAITSEIASAVATKRAAEIAGKDGDGKALEVRAGRAIFLEPGDVAAHKGKGPARATTEF